MTHADNQRIAANYMGAIAHLLCGRRGRHGEFLDRVQLLLCGSAPDAIQLLQFADGVRRTGVPVLWVHHAADRPNIPDVGLVAPVDGQAQVFENCMLWMSRATGRAQLVPDSFQWGSFRFDDKLRLRRIGNAPAPDFKAAEPGMALAYTRLRELEALQIKRGDVFMLPELMRAG